MVNTNGLKLSIIRIYTSNMDYKLAKELKEAGFPQLRTVFKQEDNTFGEGKGGITNYKDGEYYKPTLDELIEACGDYFMGMQKGGKDCSWDWMAFTRLDKEVTEGKTPLEAVARLWLELNKD